MTPRRAAPLLVAAVAAVAVVAFVVASIVGARTEIGLVVAVDSSGLADVRAFDLRTPDGRTIAFRVGRLENAAEFPPAHLLEHRALAQPVRVHYRDEGGERVAYRIEDAP